MEPHLGCPQCLAPLAITDRRTLPSTGGPVPMVKVLCAAGHRFHCPPDLLPAPG